MSDESHNAVDEFFERYDMVCMATQMTVWEMNANSNVVTWNAYLGIVFKHPYTATTRDWWIQHIHPDDVPSVDRTFDDWLNSTTPTWVFEYRFLCGDGRYIWVQDHAVRIFNDEGVEIRRLGTMLNVNKYRTQRLELIKRNIQLGDVAQMIAHELRGPLSTLMGLATLAQEGDLNEESRPIIERIVETTGRLDTQVQHMISVSTGLQSCGLAVVDIIPYQAGEQH